MAKTYTAEKVRRHAEALRSFRFETQPARDRQADKLADMLTAFAERLEADERGEREVSFQIWQDDMMVAGSDDISDALHYVAVYSQDGPVELREVTSYSRVIELPSDEGKADG